MTGAPEPGEALSDFLAGLPEVRRLGVAVSGGGDSLALLYLLKDHGGPELAAATVDHGLRTEAAAEAAEVARHCAGLGIPHRTLRWDGWDGSGNLQDRAREARFRLLAGWAQAEGLDAVALGHTLDDQAETVLMRLARASGVDGLSAMSDRVTRHGVLFLRPLLKLRRQALREVLTERGVAWTEDPSNTDPRFDRVRARQALDALAPLGVDAGALARVSANMSDARRALGAAAADIVARIGRSEAGDLVFQRAPLLDLPDELFRRLVGAALNWVVSGDYPPRAEAVMDLAGAIRDRRDRTLHGCRVLTSENEVRITREAAAVRDTITPTDALWDGRWRLDGPHAQGLEVRVLGAAVADCPDWRATGLPRETLLASPAVWDGDTLIAAPVAGLSNGWRAEVPGLESFRARLIAH